MENSNTLLARAREAAKKLKTFGIIIAIIMILLGAVACFAPILGQQIVLWSMVAGLFISGIEEIINFCASPKGLRNGFALATGIIWVILCIMLFISAINADALSSLFTIVAFDYFLAIMLAFSCIFNAISDFCLCGRAEELGRTKGGLIASGVLGILAGIVIMSFPVGSIITLEIFYAAFLLIGGIALLCRCLSYKTKE